MIPLHDIVIKIANPTYNYNYTAITQSNSVNSTTTKFLGIQP